jgi:hypothetical protein
MQGFHANKDFTPRKLFHAEAQSSLRLTRRRKVPDRNTFMKFAKMVQLRLCAFFASLREILGLCVKSYQGAIQKSEYCYLATIIRLVSIVFPSTVNVQLYVPAGKLFASRCICPEPLLSVIIFTNCPLASVTFRMADVAFDGR